MSSADRTRTARRLAVSRRLGAACLVCAVGAAALIGSATSAATTRKPTAAAEKAPVYEFLRKSGFSKRARPESAVVSGVVTVDRGGRKVVTSTVRAVHKKETLDAIQAAIINGTPVEAPPEAAEAEAEGTEVGSLVINYSDGNTLTVTIYPPYYKIVTSAGTMRFTSEPLTTILRELLQ